MESNNFNLLIILPILVGAVSGIVVYSFRQGGLQLKTIDKTVRYYNVFMTVNYLSLWSLILVSGGSKNFLLFGSTAIILSWVSVGVSTKVCRHCGTFNGAKGFMKSADTCSKCGESLKKNRDAKG